MMLEASRKIEQHQHTKPYGNTAPHSSIDNVHRCLQVKRRVCWDEASNSDSRGELGILYQHFFHHGAVQAHLQRESTHPFDSTAHLVLLLVTDWQGV